MSLSLLTSSFFAYKGPDFVWHIDGYVKLKPYGFTIHGCVDGLAHACLFSIDVNACFCLNF